MARFALLLLICCSGGCFGLSQNPSYFPYYLPTGDIVRTHAKPGGLGYFKNFDPKACSIELSPSTCSNPTKTQVVLVASVVDKDGDARRKRRVEWTLEGPGSIVEVDESGYLQGRGYQVNEKYAVSYTDMTGHTMSRGGKMNDLKIEAGQTWCVVSCPVDGQTIVTAYAPEVHDWEKRRAFSRLTWSDGSFVPVPGPVRSGRETDSTLNELAKKDGPVSNEAALVLDAKLPKAVAINSESTAKISLANQGRQDSTAATIRAVIPDGTELVRTEPAPSRRSGRELFWNVDRVPGGQSRDIAMTLKPTKTGAFTLAAFADTTDGMKASTKADSYADTAGIRIDVGGPDFAAVGESAEVRITVNNSGNVPIENAVAWVTPDTGLSTPSGTVPGEVRIGSIPAGSSRTVNAALNAEKSGKSKVRVDVTADGGLSARGETTVTVGKAELMVKVVGPETVPFGDTATYEVQVTNAGDVPASSIEVKATLPRGLVAKTDANTSSDGGAWKLATLAPGEKKTFRLVASGDRLSELGSITASASGSIPSGKLPTAKTSVPAGVRGQPVLIMELIAPTGTVAINGKAQYRIVVRNKGTGPAKDVIVNAEFSEQLRATRSSTGSVSSNQATFDRVNELAVGGTLTLTVDADAVAVGDARINVTLQAKDLPGPLREEQSTRVSKR
ncbi:hypothetical protein BH11PLA2_BH11PLA2_34940 [soil metagenome]